MPYVTVPRDLSRVKAKVMFGLTKRQLICIGAAAGIGIPLYILTFPALGSDNASLLAMIPAVPFLIVGFYISKDNQPLEKKILNYIRVRMVLPRVRPYKTENIYKKLELLSDIQEVINRADEEIEESTDGTANTKGRNRNKKN